jgi:hypothetical protein
MVDDHPGETDRLEVGNRIVRELLEDGDVCDMRPHGAEAQRMAVRSGL